jgi:hypothetical protein
VFKHQVKLQAVPKMPATVIAQLSHGSMAALARQFDAAR